MKKIRILLVVVLILSLMGCGSNSNEAMNTNNVAMDMEDADYALEAPSFGGVEKGANFSFSESAEEEALVETTTNTQVVDERKIIKSASMDLETLEFDHAIKLLTEKVEAIGGYIESSSVQGKSIDDRYSTRYANYSLRIPQEHFLTFMADLNSVGNIVYENKYGEDITAQYYDTEAHLSTLEIQEERLLDILKKAEKIEDVITLERELSNVRYQIESLQGSMKRWDNLVSYSTIQVSIREVVEITEIKETPKTLGEKIANSFSDSVKGIKRFFENLTIFLIGNIPYLIIYVPVIIIIVLIIRKFLRKPKVKIENIEEEKK